MTDNHAQKDSETVESIRETATCSIMALIEVRRGIRLIESERDEATAELRRQLTEVEAPFKERLAPENALEGELKAMATGALVDFRDARHAELVAGNVCAQFKCPEGSRLSWLARAQVHDFDALEGAHADLVERAVSDPKRLVSLLKSGANVPGAELVQIPSVSVTSEQTDE